MYGSYVEIAAYNQDLDEDGQFAPYLLSSQEESLPARVNPRMSKSSPLRPPSATNEDFILVAEFSEIEGPQPLFTIPDEAEVGFDLNEFAVRILSVDHQMNTSGPFSISEDTQVLLTDPITDIQSYVHYFTLYDVAARGFVRPVCVAYITQDKKKILDNFADLRSKFTEITEILKYSNRISFLKEADQHLKNLAYTKDRYLQWKRDVAVCASESSDAILPSEVQDLKAVSLEMLASSISEMQHVIHAIGDVLNDKDMDEILSLTEKRVRSSSSTSILRNVCPYISGVLSESPKCSIVKMSRKFDRNMKTVSELCKWGFVLGISLLNRIHKFYKRDSVTLYMEKKDQELTVNDRMPSKELLRPLISTSVSRLERLSLTLDALERSLIFMFCRPTWIAELKQPLVKATIAQASGILMMNGYVLTNVLQDVPTNDIPQVSSDSVTSKRRLLMDKCTDLQLHLSELRPLLLGAAHRSIPSDIGLEDGDGSDDDFADAMETPDAISYSPKDAASESADDVAISGKMLAMDKEIEVEESSDEEYKDVENSEAEDRVAISANSIVNHIEMLTPDKPGFGIAQVFQKYSCCLHMLYSLLIGRPLVIVGSSCCEDEVRAIVQAFDLFVPEKSGRDAVMPWSYSVLRLKDLTKLRLIGICIPDKKSMDSVVPKSVKQYISILDIGSKVFNGPFYVGTSLSQLSQVSPSLNGDAMLVSHIFSLLMALASKVFLYYHCSCAGEKDLSDSSESSQTSDHETEKLVKTLGLDKQDETIIKYLADMIKRKQVMTNAPLEGDFHPIAPILKVVHEQLNMLKL